MTLAGLFFIGFIAFVYECRISQIRKESNNKIRFFIMIGDISNEPYLVIRDIDGSYHLISDADHLSNFGINASEYSEMPMEEVKEVFINLED